MNDRVLFFSSRRRHTRYWRDWSSDVCSSDLTIYGGEPLGYVVEFESHLMLLFTGFSRIASEVAGKKIQNLLARERQLKAMRGMVDEGVAVLTDERRPVAEVGQLLHQGWMMKRELAEGVTTSAIDEIYEAARAAGAIGGKLLGAGGGGFMLLFAEPGRQAAIREALRGLVHVRFRLGAAGSRVVVYEPD